MIVRGDAFHIPLPAASVDLVVTSPPYSNARPEYSSWQGGHDAYLIDMALAYKECFRVMRDGARIGVNIVHGYGRPGNDDHGYFPLGHKTTDALEAAGFVLRGVIIWNKTSHVLATSQTAWGSWRSATNPSLRDQHELIVVGHKGSAHRSGEGRRSTIDSDTFIKATSSIWVIPPAAAPWKWHPAPFPEEIPRRLIELYTFEGDTVLDPFSGSGTTQRVAVQLGRVGIGLEIKADYARKSAAHLPQKRFEFPEAPTEPPGEPQEAVAWQTPLTDAE